MFTRETSYKSRKPAEEYRIINQVEALENAYTYNHMYHNLESFMESSSLQTSFNIWPVHAYHKLVFRLIIFKKTETEI